MAQRGRKSRASTNIPMVNGARAALNPPEFLSDAEADVFAELAASAPHLANSDGSLLASLAQATVLARTLHKTDLEKWERAVRVQIALSTKLRLTAQARRSAEYMARRT